jgi:4-hydroxybenzoate polyprenyltransferase
MLAAHDLGNLSVWLAALAAFTALSFTASAVYILNDLCDLDLDRSHLEKKHRPLAAGQLSIPAALSAIPAFFIAGLIVAQASPKMIPFLLVYIDLTTIYSFFLKNLLAIDIIILALLYTLRILAGAAACEITPSNWLLVFSFFTFFSLAIGKRFSEMVLLGNSISLQRAYTPQHSLPLLALGAAASIIAIFIPALYVRDPQAGIYSKPEILLLLLPILGAWFTRFWLNAAEGKILSDPVLFAAKDKFSWACAAIFVCVGFLASKIGN